MKTALVCLAKNEDFYIDEWIKYHSKLGFDFFYIYQNNWRYKGDKSQYNNVHWIEFDGQIKQLESYQNFIKFHNNEYDWAAFFDIDEFLVLKYQKNLKNWLDTFNDYYAIGINWRFFGDNNISDVLNHNIINRFTKASKELNQHIKTIINLKKCKNDNIVKTLTFREPHSLIQSYDNDFTIATDKFHFIHGPFNFNIQNYTAQINHYYCKTYSEFINIKHKRGRADIYAESCYNKSDFDSANINEIDDLTAYFFWNNLIKD